MKRYLLPVLAFGLVALLLVTVWRLDLKFVVNSPASQVAMGVEEARALESSGDGSGALTAYRSIIEQHRNDANVSEAVVGYLRLRAQSVPRPCGHHHFKQAGALLTDYDELPERAKTAEASNVVVDRLVACAEEMGSESTLDAGTATYLLEEASVIAGDPATRFEVDQKAKALHRLLAERLQEKAPLAALNHFVALPHDVDAQAAALRIMESFGATPSLWVEADRDVSAWISTAESAGRKDEAARVRRLLEAARVEYARMRDVIQEADEETLGRMAESTPHNQEVIVALAQRLRQRSEPDKAALSLFGLGLPGRMTGAARLLLAGCLEDAKRLKDAELVLVLLLHEKLPSFHRNVRRFFLAAERIKAGYRVDAQRDGYPSELEAEANSRPESNRQRLLDQWLNKKVASDRRIVELRETNKRDAIVVDAALQLGKVRLHLGAGGTTEKEQKQYYESAVAALLMLEVAAQESVAYRIYLGAAYHRLGYKQQADLQFEKLLERNDPKTDLLVADTMLNLGDTDKANEIRQRAPRPVDGLVETSPVSTSAP